MLRCNLGSVQEMITQSVVVVVVVFVVVVVVVVVVVIYFEWETQQTFSLLQGCLPEEKKENYY